MSAPPPRLNRRQALTAGAASLGALALAACGESPAEEVAGSLPEGLQAQLQRNLERARAEARNVTAAAPRAAVKLPTPGAGHPVTVAMYPTNRIGGSLFGQFVNGLAAARERAEDRYTYSEASLAYGRNASTFSVSTALEAVAHQKPDIVIYFRADQADLLANDRLAPLDDFLVSDPGFNAADFWPGLLETGKHEGLQYGLPVAVSPHVLLFNRETAVRQNVEPPAPDPRTFDAEVFLDAVRALHMEPPPSGGLGSMGYISRFTPEPDGNGDYSASPSPYELLQSAVGDLRGPNGDFAPLTSQPAVQVAEFLRAWVHDHHLAITDGRSTRSFQRSGRFGFTGTILAFIPPSRLVGSSLEVYPLPNMGAGRSPVFVHAMMGVVAGTQNPEIAYDALRHLAAGLRSSSVLPATRISAEGIAARTPDLAAADANLIEQLMQDAVYSTLSRRQAGLITNHIVGNIIFGDQHPDEGMQALVDQLRADDAG
ncbi:MAG: hypothetical protein OXN91_06330 [Chloroflexota bacterium]|nr:hypothetical protein [Chloroflexota bacterium]